MNISRLWLNKPSFGLRAPRLKVNKMTYPENLVIFKEDSNMEEEPKNNAKEEMNLLPNKDSFVKNETPLIQKGEGALLDDSDPFETMSIDFEHEENTWKEEEEKSPVEEKTLKEEEEKQRLSLDEKINKYKQKFQFI